MIIGLQNHEKDDWYCPKRLRLALLQIVFLQVVYPAWRWRAPWENE